jgi:hypothetical protein
MNKEKNYISRKDVEHYLLLNEEGLTTRTAAQIFNASNNTDINAILNAIYRESRNNITRNIINGTMTWQNFKAYQNYIERNKSVHKNNIDVSVFLSKQLDEPEVPKNKITEILLDMDGVLVDNMRGLAELEGISVNELLRIKAARKLVDPDFDFVVHLIRKHIYNNDHFSDAPPLPEFTAFKKLIKHWLSNGIKVQILSSGCSASDIYPEICKQKELWLEKHGLGILPTNYAKGSKEKQKWAQPHILLIDDYPRNIEQFRNAGGNAIQHSSIEQTIKELLEFNLL